jgi:hypothetical protein
VFLSDGSSKTPQNRFAKDRVEKFLQKIDKNPKPKKMITFFGRFSVRGFQNHDRNITKKNLTLVLFWPLTHPPTTGVTDIFLPAPCVLLTPAGRRRRCGYGYSYMIPSHAPGRAVRLAAAQYLCSTYRQSRPYII